MLSAFFFVASVSVLHAASVQPTEPVSLDRGVQVALPGGWTLDSANRETLLALGPRGSAAWVAVGNLQVDVDPAAANAVGRRAINRLRSAGYDAGKVTRAEVRTEGDLAVALVRAEGSAPGKPDAVALMLSWPVEAGMVHVGVRGPLADEAVLAAALERWKAAVSGGNPPADLASLGGAFIGDNGVGVTLPAGWRKPLQGELEALSPALKNIGMVELDPARCWMAMTPTILDEADLVVGCVKDLQIGVLDEHSLPYEEESIRGQLFGSKATAREAGEAVTLGDRLSIFYPMPSDGHQDAIMAITPFGNQALMTYGLVREVEGQTARSTVEALLPSAVFPGADNGAPQIAATEWISYGLRARLGLVSLVLSPALAWAVLMWQRAAKRQRELALADDV